MPLIPCARGCVYQSEGCCGLAEIHGGGMGDGDCSYYIPRGGSAFEKAGAGLKDRLNADQLKGGGEALGK